MAQQTHVLIDASQSLVRDDVMFGDDGSDGHRSWKLLLRQCRGGRSDGVHVVTLDNGAMSIDVLPTRVQDGKLQVQYRVNDDQERATQA